MALTKRFGNFQPFVQQAGNDREVGLQIGLVTYEPSEEGGEEYRVTSMSIAGRSDHLMEGVNAFRDQDPEVLTTSAPLDCDKQILCEQTEEKSTTTTKVVVKPSDAVLTEAAAA